MDNHDILDHGFRRDRTPEEESELQLLKLDAQQAARRIQHGRYALYVVCGVSLIFGAFLLFSSDGANTFGIEGVTNFELAIGLIFFGGIYVALAMASFRYPKIALGLATGIYLLSQLIDAIDNPMTLFRGIIIKVIIIYYFIRAVQSSIKMEGYKKRAAELGATEEELLS